MNAMELVDPITHAPGSDGLFADTALCGLDAQGRMLRMTDILADVDCLVCADLLATKSQG